MCVAAPPGALEHQIQQLRRGRQSARRARRGGGVPEGQWRHLSFSHSTASSLLCYQYVKIDSCFPKIQVGSKNESLQKVLDKFDLIKAKVGEEGEEC